MKTFCHLIGKYFGIIAVVFLILGMTVPDSFKWVVGNIGGIGFEYLIGRYYVRYGHHTQSP